MNGQGQTPNNDDADRPAPARGRSSATPDTGLTTEPSVPDYELLRRIGRGAYGDVWLARSKATGALRAAKIVWRHTFENERPFKREFEGIQRFERISREHPSQLALFHIGRNEADGYFYYVMELADDGSESRLQPAKTHDKERGLDLPASDRLKAELQTYIPHTLRADLERGRLPAARVLEIGLALTEALSHLHSNGLIHRDVKPSNMIFVNGRPKLADIGLVTDASDQCSIVGTEGYLPPEGPGTPQADIFALGKVLYEAATGLDRREFPNLPPDVRSWLDAAQVFELNEIILKACAKDSHDRYATTESMLAELQRLDGGKSIRQARRVEHGWRLARLGAACLAATAAVLALVVLANGAWLTPTPHVEKRSTNEVANLAYDRGRAFVDRMRGTNFGVAVDCFKQAIRADPWFGQAYAYLAWTYGWSDGIWNPGWKFLPESKAAATQALKLDDSLALAHIALAWQKAMGEWSWAEAEKEYKVAFRLGGSASLCHYNYGEFLRMVGRTNEALVQINEARALEPRSVAIQNRFIGFLHDSHRFDEVLAQTELLTDMDPNTATTSFVPAALCALRRYPEAIEAERKTRTAAGEPKENFDRELDDLQRVFANDGFKAGFMAYWNRELTYSTKWNDAYGQAQACAQLGETNKAITCLQTALKERNTALVFGVMTDWRLDPLRSDQRFHTILKTMRFE